MRYNKIPVTNTKKKPFHKGWAKYQKELYTNLIPENSNVAVVTGTYDLEFDPLYVVDIDIKVSEYDIEQVLQNLTALGININTKIVKTGSGGLHLYYLLDNEDSYDNIKTNEAINITSEDPLYYNLSSIDGRGQGGVVFAPPTKFDEHENSYTNYNELEPLKIGTDELKIFYDKVKQDNNEIVANTRADNSTNQSQYPIDYNKYIDIISKEEFETIISELKNTVVPEGFRSKTLMSVTAILRKLQIQDVDSIILNELNQSFKEVAIEKNETIAYFVNLTYGRDIESINVNINRLAEKHFYDCYKIYKKFLDRTSLHLKLKAEENKLETKVEQLRILDIDKLNEEKEQEEIVNSNLEVNRSIAEENSRKEDFEYELEIKESGLNDRILEKEQSVLRLESIENEIVTDNDSLMRTNRLLDSVEQELNAPVSDNPVIEDMVGSNSDYGVLRASRDRYNTRISEINSRIVNNNQNKTNIQDRMVIIEQEIVTIGSETTSVNNSIADIENTISILNGRLSNKTRLGEIKRSIKSIVRETVNINNDIIVIKKKIIDLNEKIRINYYNKNSQKFVDICTKAFEINNIGAEGVCIIKDGLSYDITNVLYQNQIGSIERLIILLCKDSGTVFNNNLYFSNVSITARKNIIKTVCVLYLDTLGDFFYDSSKNDDNVYWFKKQDSDKYLNIREIDTLLSKTFGSTLLNMPHLEMNVGKAIKNHIIQNGEPMVIPDRLFGFDIIDKKIEFVSNHNSYDVKLPDYSQDKLKEAIEFLEDLFREIDGCIDNSKLVHVLKWLFSSSFDWIRKTHNSKKPNYLYLNGARDSGKSLIFEIFANIMACTDIMGNQGSLDTPARYWGVLNETTIPYLAEETVIKKVTKSFDLGEQIKASAHNISGRSPRNIDNTLKERKKSKGTLAFNNNKYVELTETVYKRLDNVIFTDSDVFKIQKRALNILKYIGTAFTERIIKLDTFKDNLMNMEKIDFGYYIIAELYKMAGLIIPDFYKKTIRYDNSNDESSITTQEKIKNEIYNLFNEEYKKIKPDGIDVAKRLKDKIIRIMDQGLYNKNYLQIKRNKSFNNEIMIYFKSGLLQLIAEDRADLEIASLEHFNAILENVGKVGYHKSTSRKKTLRFRISEIIKLLDQEEHVSYKMPNFYGVDVHGFLDLFNNNKREIELLDDDSLTLEEDEFDIEFKVLEEFFDNSKIKIDLGLSEISDFKTVLKTDRVFALDTNNKYKARADRVTFINMGGVKLINIHIKRLGSFEGDNSDNSEGSDGSDNSDNNGSSSTDIVQEEPIVVVEEEEVEEEELTVPELLAYTLDGEEEDIGDLVFSEPEPSHNHLNDYLQDVKDVEYKEDVVVKLKRVNIISVVIQDSAIKNIKSNDVNMEYVKVQYKGFDCNLMLVQNQLNNIIVGYEPEVRIDTIFVKNNKVYLALQRQRQN